MGTSGRKAQLSRRSIRSTYGKEIPAKIAPSVPQLDLRASRAAGWAAGGRLEAGRMVAGRPFGKLRDRRWGSGTAVRGGFGRSR